MPKKALTATEWRQRLHSYASGTFRFGRGQRPQPNSYWARELANVEACPKHETKAQGIDVLGRKLLCKCGYHKVEPKIY